MFKGCIDGAQMPKISNNFGVRDGYKTVRYLLIAINEGGSLGWPLLGTSLGLHKLQVQDPFTILYINLATNTTRRSDMKRSPSKHIHALLSLAVAATQFYYII
jgi:hypothetical protein